MGDLNTPIWQSTPFKGTQYHEVRERLKKEHPEAYKNLEDNILRSEYKTSERPGRLNINGKWESVPNQGAGYLDAADPIGSLYVEGAALNPIFKGIGKVAEVGLAKLGNSLSRSKIINKALSKSIDDFDGTVGNSYFKAPDKWYRITETPEVGTIKELGKNVTTIDSDIFPSMSSKWREGLLETKASVVDGGWAIPRKKTFNLKKMGSAHGNVSQASSGEPWDKTIAASRLFPKVILEGQAPNTVRASYNAEIGKNLDRSQFLFQDWSKLPPNTRIGFKTGEMPLDNLKAFTLQSNNRYTIAPVIPNKIGKSYTPFSKPGNESLKFFEKPTKITEMERLGIPKGDRNNLNKF